MDRHEPQVPTNSTNADTEISAARRILNGTGNFLKNEKNRLSKAAVVGIVGLALVGCGANANAEGPEETAPPAPTSTSIEETPTSEPTPSETAVETEAPSGLEDGTEYIPPAPAVTPENRAQRLAELQFSSEMTPQEMGEHYTEVISSWAMAGASHDAFRDWLDSATNELDIAAPIAEGNRSTYATALFGDDLTTVPDNIGYFINNATEINQANIIRYLLSTGDEEYPNPNTENRETWHVQAVNQGVTVEEQTDTSLTIIVRQMTDNNANFTMFEGSDADSEGHVADTRLEFDMSTGTPIIAHMMITDVETDTE